MALSSMVSRRGWWNLTSSYSPKLFALPMLKTPKQWAMTTAKTRAKRIEHRLSIYSPVMLLPSPPWRRMSGRSPIALLSVSLGPGPPVDTTVVISLWLLYSMLGLSAVIGLGTIPLMALATSRLAKEIYCKRFALRHTNARL